MTDDYTPSLEYLRSRYIAEGFAAVESWQRKPEFRRALSDEFDRGIAAHDAEVAESARAAVLRSAGPDLPGHWSKQRRREVEAWLHTYAARTPDPNGDNT